jgi:hypothetical protein
LDTRQQQQQQQQHFHKEQNETWQKSTILSGVVKQSSNGKQQTLADLFKELVAGANIKTTSHPTTKIPDSGKPEERNNQNSEIRTNVQATNVFGKQGVSNLTARLVA